MELPKTFSRLPRPQRVPSLAGFLLVFLFATFFAAWHVPFTFWESHLPASILPRLFPHHSLVPRPVPPDNSTSCIVEDATAGSLPNGGEPPTCNFFEGSWVDDDEGPRYPPGSCPFAEEAFDCFGNGRPDSNYTKLRWKPKGCNLPRMDGKGMLEKLKGRRLVFVGDSLNRNMWESLACLLRESAPDKNRVFEISGRQDLNTEGFYAIKYDDYNCTVEFFQTPFLVQEWEVPDPARGRKETLRLDIIHEFSSKYQDADILVFNTAHWWTHPRTAEGKGFYQEGGHVYSQLSAEDAYRKALRTWAKWVDTNIDPNRTAVFFRGYSSSHFSGGQWNSGGNCDGETVPITDDTQLQEYPEMMSILDSVMGEMRTPVHYLNITRMTGYRKDAHPSAFRWQGKGRQPNVTQDCSHWCLPGVPDDWNELLYAMLLRDAQQPLQI